MRTCDLELCTNKHYAKGFCRKHWREQYYLNNEEYRIKAQERTKAWAKDNPDKVKQRKQSKEYKDYQKEYRLRNPDYIKDIQKSWRDANPNYLAGWRDKNRESHNEKQNKRRALKAKNGIFLISAKEIKKIYSSACAMCGSEKGIEMDHIIPISKGGRHSIGNVQPLCGGCNRSKSDKIMVKWKAILKVSGNYGT